MACGWLRSLSSLRAGAQKAESSEEAHSPPACAKAAAPAAAERLPGGSHGTLPRHRALPTRPGRPSGSSGSRRVAEASLRMGRRSSASSAAKQSASPFTTRLRVPLLLALAVAVIGTGLLSWLLLRSAALESASAGDEALHSVARDLARRLASELRRAVQTAREQAAMLQVSRRPALRPPIAC